MARSAVCLSGGNPKAQHTASNKSRFYKTREDGAALRWTEEGGQPCQNHEESSVKLKRPIAVLGGPLGPAIRIIPVISKKNIPLYILIRIYKARFEYKRVSMRRSIMR